MNLRSPWLSLILLGTLALALAFGGARLARRVENVRVERDGAPLRGFEEALQTELSRLEQLYEKHARLVANTPPDSDAAKTKKNAEWLVGLRQLSLIGARTPADAKNDVHIPIDARIGEELPLPAFVRGNDPGLPKKRIILPADELLESEPDRGWIAQPGQSTIFWQRLDSGRVAVLLINVEAVRASMNKRIAAWTGEEFEPVRVAGGPDALLAPDDTQLASVGNTTAQPNMLLPLRTRFGTWRLASWDRFETRESFHQPTLLAGIGAAVLVAMLGVFVFAQQRAANRLAAQRVSFVNSVSHELRTPLTNMLLNLDLVAEQVPEPAEARLGLVREEAGRLGRLIENVLTFSRGEQGKLTIRAAACRPVLVIDSVTAQFAASFERKKIALLRKGDAAEPCVLDPDALAQIIANLLSNVEKYAPGSEVTLTSIWENGVLIMRVADTGPGIPAHAAERIFYPFERVDSLINEGSTGTGLGLAIARELAQEMGGTLALMPSERGATFELRVPAPPVPEPKTAAA